MAANTIELGPVGEQVIANVTRLRKQLRLSQAQLSERLAEAGRPIRATGIHRVETGKRRVDVDDLVALAGALGVRPAALMEAPDYHCQACMDAPPRGFLCQRCGRAS